MPKGVNINIKTKKGMEQWVIREQARREMRRQMDPGNWVHMLVLAMCVSMLGYVMIGLAAWDAFNR
jgi:hypothetical protein